MNFKNALDSASEAAYEEDFPMVIGQVAIYDWIVAHAEDIGRQADMICPKIEIDSSGITQKGFESILDEISSDCEFQGCPLCIEESSIQYQLPFYQEMAIQNNNQTGWHLVDYQPLKKKKCICQT